MLEMAMASIDQRTRAAEKREEDARRRRMARLPEHLLRAGVPDAERLGQNAMLMVQLDQMLLTEFAGQQRRADTVRAALQLVMSGVPE